MKTIKYISVAAALLSISSCSFLDMKPAVIESGTFYSSVKEVKSGLVGVYGAIGREEFYGSYYSVMASNIDDLSYFNRQTTSSYLQFYSHDPSSPEIYQMWTAIYDGIKNANSYLKAIENSEFDKDHRYYNEARFLRAYYHFILAQAWGDVPLRKEPTTNPMEVMIPATPQLEVLQWAVGEMGECLKIYEEHPEFEEEDLLNAPSRVCRTTILGIMARVYLFMAGESVSGTEAQKEEYYKNAMDCAYAVIESGNHFLNNDYSMIFKNMMSDKYDTAFRESMWEADFMGDRSSAESWSNGRIGDGLGLQSSGSSGFDSFKCNFAYGQYNGTLKLWDLYWVEDRTDDQKGSTDSRNYFNGKVTDVRQEWNMRAYNYSGSTNQYPYDLPKDKETSSNKKCQASIDKTPYNYDSKSTRDYAGAAPAVRNCGKFSREVEWEGVRGAKNLYNGINFPILRYADVLLMYAEAYNEYHKAPSEEVFGYILRIRERAGIKTRDYAGNYDSYETFRALVRNERGRELVFEGLRKYDLIRWGIFVKEMNGYAAMAEDMRWSKWAYTGIAASIGTNVQQKHVVLPIPAIELGVNSLLVQNPLW